MTTEDAQAAEKVALTDAERDGLADAIHAYENSCGSLEDTSVADGYVPAIAAAVERIVADRVAEAVERERAAWAAKIEPLIPPACWSTRSDVGPDCTAMIGGSFPNGAKWTEDMCCLPCRLRALLTAGDTKALAAPDPKDAGRDGDPGRGGKYPDQPPTATQIAAGLRAEQDAEAAERLAQGLRGEGE